MWFKDNVREVLSIIFGVAFIVFTGMGLIPPEAFVGVAIALVTYFFEEKSKDSLKRRIVMLEGQLNTMRKEP